MVSHRSSPEIRGKKPLGPGLPRDLQPGEVGFLRALRYSSPMAGARAWLSQSGNSCRGRTPRAPGSRLRRQCGDSVTVLTHVSFSFSIRGPRACRLQLRVRVRVRAALVRFLPTAGLHCTPNCWGLGVVMENRTFFFKKIHLLNGQAVRVILLDCAGQS
jgi:hypothetical protein